MTPEQEADIRAKARRVQQLQEELAVANLACVGSTAATRLAAAEEYAVLQVEAQRAYFALRAAQDAAANEGATP